jgi:hypothetical protein
MGKTGAKRTVGRKKAIWSHKVAGKKQYGHTKLQDKSNMVIQVSG